VVSVTRTCTRSASTARKSAAPNRTDYWGEDVNSALHRTDRTEDILQFRAPRYVAIDHIVDRAVTIAQSVVPVVKQLKNAGFIK
jgi:hypothetical protein